MAVPTIRSVGANAVGTTSATPGLPSGTAEGDLLITVVASAGATTFPAQAGFQSIRSVQNGTALTDSKLSVLWKIAGAGETATQVTTTVNHVSVRTIAITAGTFNADAPIHAESGGNVQASTVDVSISGLTTTLDDCLILSLSGASLPDANSTAEYDSWANADLTNGAEQTDNNTNQGNGGGHGTWSGSMATAGTVGATTVTKANAALMANLMVAIAPPGTATFDVAASGDDGAWVVGVTYDNTATEFGVGNSGGAALRSWTRFPNVTIPAGATIHAAHVRMMVATATGLNTVNSDIFMNDADDAVAPTTRAEAEALVMTTASTVWDNIPNQLASAPKILPNTAAALQEVINRPGWTSGNAVMMLWLDGGSTTNATRLGASFDHATLAPARLSVTYTGVTAAQLVGFSAVGAGTVTAAVKSPKLFAPVVVSAGTVTAAVSTPALFTATVVGASTVTATVTSPVTFAPIVVSASTVSAAVMSRALLTPTVTSAASVTVGVHSRALLSPTVSSTSTVTATLSTPATFTPTVAAASTVTAEVTSPGVAFFTVTVVSASTVTAAVESRALFSATVVSASTVTAAVHSRALMTATVVSASTVTVQVDVPGIAFLTVTVVGSSTVTAAVKSRALFAPTVVSAGTVAAALRSPALFVPLIVGSTSVSAAVMSRTLFVPVVQAAAVVAAALHSQALITVSVTGALSMVVTEITDIPILPSYGVGSVTGYQTTAVSVASGDGPLVGVNGHTTTTTSATGST